MEGEGRGEAIPAATIFLCTFCWQTLHTPIHTQTLGGIYNPGKGSQKHWDTPYTHPDTHTHTHHKGSWHLLNQSETVAAANKMDVTVCVCVCVRWFNPLVPKVKNPQPQYYQIVTMDASEEFLLVFLIGST